MPTPLGLPIVILPFLSPRDTVLVTRIAGGDRGAFRILYQRFHRPVETHVRRIPIAADVPSIVAATFVEVWWLARHHTGGEVRGWVLGIADRRAADRRGGPVGDWPQPRESSHVALAQLLGGRPRSRTLAQR
jgi:DNA-directed RNA polymerase specialized sigma24 family protein